MNFFKVVLAAALAGMSCPSSTAVSTAAQTVGTASSTPPDVDAGTTVMSLDAGGLTRAQLVPTVMAGRANAYVCFRDAPDCAAKATLRIIPSGRVADVKVQRISGEPLEPKVASCLAAVIMRWKFPDAGTDTVFSHVWECKKSSE